MQNHNFIKRSKVRKVTHTFLPKGIQIEVNPGLLPCLVSQLALLAELIHFHGGGGGGGGGGCSTVGSI